MRTILDNVDNLVILHRLLDAYKYKSIISKLKGSMQEETDMLFKNIVIVRYYHIF